MVMRQDPAIEGLLLVRHMFFILRPIPFGRPHRPFESFLSLHREAFLRCLTNNLRVPENSLPN
jgi:hypothetical protein